MTYHRLTILVCGAGLMLLSACGKTPSEHTVIDYESLEPRTGHGANSDPAYRYGHTDRRHEGTGFGRGD